MEFNLYNNFCNEKTRTCSSLSLGFLYWISLEREDYNQARPRQNGFVCQAPARPADLPVGIQDFIRAGHKANTTIVTFARVIVSRFVQHILFFHTGVVYCAD